MQQALLVGNVAKDVRYGYYEDGENFSPHAIYGP